MKTSNSNISQGIFDVYCGRGQGWKNDPMLCSVGEYGWLGSPIRLGKECPVCGDVHSKQGETLSCYEKYLKIRLQEESFREAFIQLKGLNLGCFCKPKPCHTDVMVSYLERMDQWNFLDQKK